MTGSTAVGSAAGGAPPAAELRGITKRFGPVLAVDGVDLALERGTVHAVVGENGAGKSTLMSVLYGLHRPDAGQVLRDGREVRLGSPLDAIAAGLGMVHQHFRLFGSLTVAENVVYRAEPARFGVLDRRAAQERVAELSARIGLDVDPTARVDTLPLGVRQRVEILKALHRRAEVLILDEPTAVLTPGEVDSLFVVVRRMAEQGTTVALVTHKVREVLEVTDRVTVLRDGVVTARLTTAQTTAGEIVEAMIGRGLVPAVNPRGAVRGDPVLEVDGLRMPAAPGASRVQDVSLRVSAGEVVGIAGVSGNGQRELVEAVVGLRRPESGGVRLHGRDLAGLGVRERRRLGIAYVPEDRQGMGTAASLSVADNLALGHHRTPPIGRRGRLSPRALRAQAAELVRRLGVKTAGVAVPVSSLSGGNAQKVVLARELHHEAPLLVVEQPTQGVDVGAGEEIHRLLLDVRSRGGAVLLVSYEITELRALADRVLVMLDGAVTAELDAAEATEEVLGAAMVQAGRAGSPAGSASGGGER
ncbi:ABC transporter ATP-binding protein [Trujillonella endophytica]|uniref:Nucleoside ABC transporter ATP-binding protein n=1 Tax=Trujillonella endophytica TaxID=673521 RepID=A0A1H8WNP3_9ACTN|nr:ABC transporter ATP-binding protein [Trujillella endophytica]SEP29265.1 nucleoside ABC transporter ATP-binding protein [Trujillella endophytica]